MPLYAHRNLIRARGNCRKNSFPLIGKRGFDFTVVGIVGQFGFFELQDLRLAKSTESLFILCHGIAPISLFEVANGDNGDLNHSYLLTEKMMKARFLLALLREVAKRRERNE